MNRDQLDRDLRELSKRRDKAERNGELELTAALEADIDHLLDERNLLDVEI